MRYTDQESEIEGVAWQAARQVRDIASSLTEERKIDIAVREFANALASQFGRAHFEHISTCLGAAAQQLRKF